MIIVLIILQLFLQDVCGLCPAGWMERPGSNSCYRFWSSRKMDWTTARKACQTLSGDLLKLESIEEMTWVISEVVKYPPSYEWWIGLKRSPDNETRWLWTDGSMRNESNKFILWGSGEPNNYLDSEDCGEIWDNLLNDKDCNIPLQSICERPQNVPHYCDVDNGWTDLVAEGKDIACFKAMPTQATYADAQWACMQEEGTLAAMVTESEQQALTVYLEAQDDGTDYWLPYTLNTKSRRWVSPTSNSEPAQYWWMELASDVETLVANKTLCAVLDTNTTDFNNWRPASCDDLYKPVCRKKLGICPLGYTRYNDFCFRFEIERKTPWREARSFCNIRNTKLLRIQSNDVQRFIERSIQYDSAVWLGFSGTSKDSWRWFDEGDDSTLAFGAFETNITASLASNIEMCGVLTGSGLWGVQDCGSSNAGTVCIGHVVNRPLGSPCPIEEKNCIEGPSPEPPNNFAPTFECSTSKSYALSQQNGLCYRQIPMLVDWHRARTVCAHDNAILVEPVTNETLTMLASTYGTTSDKESERWIWTGLNDREKEGQYLWQRGTSLVTKGNWIQGSPNNFEVGAVYSENCVVMATATSKTYLSSESGSIMTKWDDIPCGFKRRAVCQKIPEYNIALGKLTTVSSGEQGYKFIDDCADRNMDNGCCGLIPGPYPWWQLDLGIPFSIGSIVIHRRFKESCDVCPTEMRDFRLFISNVTGAKNVTDLIYTETSDRPQAIITVHFDTPITGRFVRIDIPEEDVHMALCEVQVFEYNGMIGRKLTPENSNCITDSTKWQGLVNHTETGLECQRWDVDIPHDHNYHHDTFAGGQNQHEAGNYCRDTRGEGQPWCYTTNPNVRWQYCGIPHCTSITNQGHKDKSATKSSICNYGWEEDPNTGACHRFGLEQLTLADAVNVCQNEGASVFVPTMESGIGVFNESEIQWLGIIYDMNTTQWKQLSGLDVPMFILDALASSTAENMTGPSCAVISVNTKTMYSADCFERHNFTCKTAEKFLVVKHDSGGGEYVAAPFQSIDHNAYKFEFRGESAAQLRFTDQNDTVHYEIKLGGKYSTQCTIKDVGANVFLYKTQLDGVTSVTDFKGFWVSWDNSEVKVGRGELIGRNQFMSTVIQALDGATLELWSSAQTQWKIYIKDKNDKEKVKQKTDVNLALNKPTRTSSLGNKYGPKENGVDGCTDGNYISVHCCTHTKNDLGAWWEVDLEQTYPIKEIVVYNRQDCCSNRLSGFVVYISGVSDSTMDNEIVYRNAMSDVPYITRIPVSGKRGRYVKISLKDRSDYLTLCEVEVMLDQDASSCNLVWHDFPQTGNCYRIIDQPMSSQQGAEVCSQLEASMALPSSPEEELFLYSLLPKPYNTSIWLPVMRFGNTMKVMGDESNLRYNRFKNVGSSVYGATLCAGSKQSTGGSWDWFLCSEEKTVICKLKELAPTTAVTYSTTTVTTVASTSMKITAVDHCQSDWRKEATFGKCYLVVQTEMAFKAAASFCNAHDATLVSFSNLAEQEFVADYVRLKMQNDNHQGGYGYYYSYEDYAIPEYYSAWIGGIDEVVEGEWSWYGSEDVPWSDDLLWDSGQPDNWPNHGGEDCATLRIRMGLLNDVHCTYEPEAFVCEQKLNTATTGTVPSSATVTALPPSTVSPAPVPFPTPAILDKCANGWVYSGKYQSCYEIFLREAITFFDAVKNCKEQNAKLTNIVDHDEQVFLQGLISRKTISGRDWDALWVAGTDIGRQEGSYIWYEWSNSPWSYTLLWKPGQPDGRNEDCASILIDSQSRDFGKLNDAQCVIDSSHTYIKGYICKQVLNISPGSTNPSTSLSTGFTTTDQGGEHYCEPGWEHDEGRNNCLMVSAYAATYPAAAGTCEEAGGTLASITSPLELMYTMGFLKKYGDAFSRLWIGLNRKSGHWMWDDQSPLSYIPWAADEPVIDDISVAVYMVVGASTDYGKWATSIEDQSYHFLCKKRGMHASTTPPAVITVGPGYGCEGRGWQEYGNSCYMFFQERNEWPDAMRKCRELGQSSDLASFKDQAEQEFIWSQLHKESYCTNIHLNTTQCEIWARAGECDYNPIWMRTNCHKSCEMCSRKCRDEYLDGSMCLQWAKDGECEINPVWMAKSCAQSCGICAGAPTRGYWLGLYSPKGTTLYTWSDHTSVSFTPWGEGEPRATKTQTRSCVGMFILTGKINSGPCDDILDGYICQQPKRLISASTSAPDGCEDTRLAYEGYCYHHVKTQLSWVNASNYCHSTFNGNLAVIKNRFQQAYLASEVANMLDDVWIGLKFYYDFPSKFIWTDGTTDIPHNNLQTKDYGQLRDGTCFALQQIKPVGLWKNYRCNATLSFLCQSRRVGWSTTPPPIVSTAPLKCADTWIKSNGMCYKLVSREEGRQTWIQANAICLHYGGSLVTILLDEIQQLVSTMTSDPVLIGLHDQYTENRFQWVSGEQYNPNIYSRWSPGEPNNYGHNEDCVMNSYGRWNDISCYTSLDFVCEVPIGKPVNERYKHIGTNNCSISSPPASGFAWYKQIDDCYYYENRSAYKKSWSEALHFCRSLNADLVSILSETENNFLTSEVSKRSRFEDIWIGIKKVDGQEIRWSDGSAVQFWTKRPGQESGDCLRFDSHGLWRYISCDSKLSFVCKRTEQDPTTTSNTSSTVTTTRTVGGCPTYFKEFENRCYFVNDPTKLVSKASAEKLCQHSGGGLVTINNELQQVFLVSMLKGQIRGLWTALSFEHDTGSFHWPNKIITYENWAPNEPSGGYDNLEDCVEMLVDTDHPGQWNDVSCLKNRGYMCVVNKDPSLPTPSIAEENCPYYYKPYNDKCYIYISEPKSTWVNSRNICERMSGKIAKLHQTEIFTRSFITASLIGSLDTKAWVTGNGMHPGTCASLHQNILNDVDTNCDEQLGVVCEADPLSAISTITIPSTTVQYGCRNSSWLHYNGFCYALVKRNGDQHLADCALIKMELAIIENEEENHRIWAWLQKYKNEANEILIGLLATFGRLMYSDGRKATYTEPVLNPYASGIACISMQMPYRWKITLEMTTVKHMLCKSDEEVVTWTDTTTATRTSATLTTAVTGEQTQTKPSFNPSPGSHHADESSNAVRLDKASGLTPGQIIGVVIGVIAGVIALCVCVYIVRNVIVTSEMYQTKLVRDTSIGFDNALFHKDREDSVSLQ
ncbi:uncharacterized protein LOC128234707 isoform X2 [Mya arenaria]|uniref:uncharacterized protein LOC128234707 isoform X2 n=1 Tax=Mya arenaria TaxID=6604 RepID=UPI0022E09B55|nr:uncharacterized protein LOC128234707 isoform X2 [Mya arenaria]